MFNENVQRDVYLKTGICSLLTWLMPSFVRFQLLSECWNEQPNDRPTFDQVTKLLEKMLMKDTPYFHLESVDESRAYYNVMPDKDAAVGGTLESPA